MSSDMSLTDFGAQTANGGSLPTTGTITCNLTDEEQELVDEVVAERHSSYEAGKTTDTNWGNSVEVMRRGIVAEVALTKLYEESELDRTVSATGDDGYDTTLTLGGDEQNVDVKARSRRNGRLMVRQDRSHHNADSFVLTYVPDSMDKCVVVGWVSKERLMVPENENRSKFGHMNHEMSQSELKNMPTPDTDRGDY